MQGITLRSFRSATLKTSVTPWQRGLYSQLRPNDSFGARSYRTSPSLSDAQPPFPVFRTVEELRPVRKQLFLNGHTVGFVPTMGALHEGHLSLIRQALQETSDVFVSIFVNPTQFAAHEDLDSYPTTWDADLAKLKQVYKEYVKSTNAEQPSRIRGIFAPYVKTMYPTLPPSSDIVGNGSWVTITPLGSQLEGRSRPIFFRGVATVCTKLFNIVQPDRVYFGQKDIQQCMLIKRMVKDFHIPTEVRVVPTVREPDGLAMSSRNVYLGPGRREDATVLSRALFAARDLYNSGVYSVAQLRRAAMKVFEEDASRVRPDGHVGPCCHIEVDYISLSHPETMAAKRESDKLSRDVGAILSGAVMVSPVDRPKTQEELNQRTVRLIDNVILEPHASAVKKVVLPTSEVEETDQEKAR